VQLARGNERPGRAIAVIVALVVALGLDMKLDRIGDPLVSTARRMLVDQRGTLAVVPIRVIRSRMAAPLFAANWLPV
jgi:hypothetical protein